MAEEQELGTTRIITQDGVVNATVVNKLSPDRLSLMLVRGSVGALYSRTEDKTDEVSRDLKDLLVYAFSEL